MRVYVYVCLSGYLGIVVLHFQVKSVLNVLVCGSNGCGKSSLFHFLGEVHTEFVVPNSCVLT